MLLSCTFSLCACGRRICEPELLSALFMRSGSRGGTDAQTHRHTRTHTDTDTHRHKHTQTHRHTDTPTHRHTDTQSHRYTDTQTHSRHTADTQTRRHTHTDRHTHADTQILVASTMLAEVEGWDLFFRCCSDVPIHFAREGVVYESLNFQWHFSCSGEAEDPDGIDDVG